VSLLGRGKIKGAEREELLDYFRVTDKINEIYVGEVRRYKEALNASAQCITDNADDEYKAEHHKLVAETEEKLVLLTEEALRHIKGIANIPDKARQLHSSYVECFEAYLEWKKAAFVATNAALQGLPSPVADNPSSLYHKATECAQKIDEMESKLKGKLA